MDVGGGKGDEVAAGEGGEGAAGHRHRHKARRHDPKGAAVGGWGRRGQEGVR